MNIGIGLLIVIAVPMFFQVLMLARDQRKRHAELIARMDRLERNLNE
jgi:hypothetical protein